MIRIKNIVKHNAILKCDVFIEDALTPVEASYDLSDGRFKHGPLPEGYEYCEIHMAYAKESLKTMSDGSAPLSEKTVMWY